MMISSIFGKIINIKHYYKKYGFIKTIVHICTDWFKYYKYAVFEKDLNEPSTIISPKIEATIRPLIDDVRDIEKLVDIWPDYLTPPQATRDSLCESIHTRLQAKEECLVAEYEGKFIFMNWFGFQNTHQYNKYVEKSDIGTGSVLSYFTYCDPDYRGNNLFAAALSKVITDLRKRGYKKLIGYVQPDNYPSMRVTRILLGEPKRIVHGINVLGFHYILYSKKLVQSNVLD